ncbi:glycoside hydrolase superfamily [Mycena polygramma]|nr:glycoside hydrolase superfamily [Mycena polygramma]
MPPAVANAECGPQVPGTANPGTAAPSTNGCISNCGTNIISAKSPPSEFLNVAYFEAFNSQRSCLNMDVRQVDTTKYSHIHFAFIELTAAFAVDTSQFQDSFNNFVALTGVKRIASFGEISLAGWAMSTDPATYTIFRNAVSSTANRQTFASNLVTFVRKHGLDGVDIDWEYPGEQDVPGIPPDSAGDGQNLAAFLALLKPLLPSGVSLSIAVPAGYWYLRAFPIGTMSSSLDYIIFMTYDLHGQWDYQSAFDDPGCPLGGCLRSHVNLTETLNSLSMITKAGVNSNKLIVGVASYGRAFKMTTAGCTGPMCTFTGPASGATPGSCTQTAGYIANAEIEKIIAAGGVQTSHDTASDSDILVYNSVQWVGYMSNTTKASRTSVYKGLNMGGTSDWAVDLQSFLPAYTPPTPPVVRNPCTQVQGWVAEWVDTLINGFQPFTVDGCGCFTDIPEEWEGPVVWEALTNWVWANRDNKDSLAGTVLGDSFYIQTGSGESPPDVTAAEYGGGNDDVLWAALGWMKYYQFWAAGGGSGKNLEFLLSSAHGFIDTVASTIPSDPCPGGVLWKPGGNSKNTITNALFIHASAMYYIITNTTSYLTQAEDVWNWSMFSHCLLVILTRNPPQWQKAEIKHRRIFTMTDPSPSRIRRPAMPELLPQVLYLPVFSEVLKLKCDHALYTYNTGQMLGAAGALYTATRNKTYLTAGNATLNGLVTSTDFNRNGVLFENTCDDSACTGNDNAWSFKGITMEGVQYFLDAANDPTITSLYSPWIGFQAASIHNNAVDSSNGDVGNVWYQQGTQVRNAATLGMAISAGNAAVKYGANNGSFTC